MRYEIVYAGPTMKPKLISARIPESLYRRVKRLAEQSDTKMQGAIKQALEAWASAQEAKRAAA